MKKKKIRHPAHLKSYSEHHYVPRSRGGKKTVQIPDNIHQAWHLLFQDLYGDEAVCFICRLNHLFKQGQIITNSDLQVLRERCRYLTKRV